MTEDEYDIEIASETDKEISSEKEEHYQKKLIGFRHQELTDLVEEFKLLLKDQNILNKEYKKEIQVKLNLLEKSSFVLHKVPSEIKEEITNLVPKIADEIASAMIKDFFSKFETVITDTRKALNELNEEVAHSGNIVKSHLKDRLKRYSFTILGLIMLSALSSAVTSYYFASQNSKIFAVEKGVNLNINNSKVTVIDKEMLKNR